MLKKHKTFVLNRNESAYHLPNVSYTFSCGYLGTLKAYSLQNEINFIHINFISFF